MPKGYHHLTRDQRCQLNALKERGDSRKIIARELRVHRSTIDRELKRNSGELGYQAKQAHETSFQRRLIASSKKLKMNELTISSIEEKLKLQWSPVQISGWLRKQGYSKAVSHEPIYQHIWKNKQQKGLLYKNLRHSGKKYNKRSKGTAGRGCIPNRVDIEERPAIVEKKVRLGDWELDTIIGAGQSGAIVSMVDRASKLAMLAKVSKKRTFEVEEP